MGVRGELFSTKVGLQNRTYFFNVKENRLGDLYLNIVESKNRDEGGFDRQSVILFAEDLEEFLRGFDESLRVLEKAAREKRREASGRNSGMPARSRRPDETGGKSAYGKSARHGDEKARDERPRSFRSRKPDSSPYGVRGGERTGENRRPRSRDEQGPPNKYRDEKSDRPQRKYKVKVTKKK